SATKAGSRRKSSCMQRGRRLSWWAPCADRFAVSAAGKLPEVLDGLGVLLSLPAISPLEFCVDGSPHVRFVETPCRTDEVIGRSVPADAFDDHAWRQQFEEIHK